MRQSSHGAEPHYGGFWVRLVATWIDGMVLSFGTLLISGFLPFLSLPAAFLIPAAYEAIMEAQSGATLGKKAFGLRVVRADTFEPISMGRSIGRHFAHYLSMFTLMIGFIMAAFDHRKRALHDRVAGTVVIKDRRD